jgi:hypothetical protein
MCEVNTIIFPSSYFNKNKVDEDLQAEYDAVVNTGLFDIIIFGYDAWFNQGKLVFSTTPDKCIKAVYRGWMMKPEQYRSFYEVLLANNIRLVTTPEDYAAMHVFPNVYESVKEDTAKMRVFPLHEKLPCSELTNEFRRFMIKDYVKSVKGTDFPKYFDNTITQEELDRWMDVFYKYRGNLLTGGICVKEYLNLKKYGDKTNEFRVFYINHKIASVSRNSGQMNISATVPENLVEKYTLLPSCYYTVDFAELEDGSWTIIEAGDGSVSGLSENQDYASYFRALYYCFN